jgi:diguanylate cyclase (GGDEF)-like protein
MLIDLDRFKQVNDTLGHAAGDALLKQVADRLVRLVGDASRVCRLGGDEFQIILPEVEDRGRLGELAEALIEDLSQPYFIDGSRCLIGASIGVAIAPFDGGAADDLVRSADLALYAAKGSGRGRFRFFSSDLLKAAEERKALEEDLHDALARGVRRALPADREGADQPVIGVEALLRWNHPRMGRFRPRGSFRLPRIEPDPQPSANGCCARPVPTRPAGRALRVAVNVSPVQFADEAFPVLVASALARSGSTRAAGAGNHRRRVPGGKRATDARFKALKNLGVRLALDDFGTGYSSLGYLGPRRSTRSRSTSPSCGATQTASRNRAIITAIVALAQALDMETTAEGVESFDQFDLMKALCVSHVQGFIYSVPLDNAAFMPRWAARLVIEPSGPARQRHQRQAMFRRVGVVHEDHYYPGGAAQPVEIGRPDRGADRSARGHGLRARSGRWAAGGGRVRRSRGISRGSNSSRNWSATAMADCVRAIASRAGNSMRRACRSRRAAGQQGSRQRRANPDPPRSRWAGARGPEQARLCHGHRLGRSGLTRSPGLSANRNKMGSFCPCPCRTGSLHKGPKG